MATCRDCSQEMTVATTCSVVVLHTSGVPIAVVPYGQERRRGRHGASRRCGDCGVATGGLHHPGCDQAECPRCRGQLLSCGCPFDELR